jgi:hypothetical protein
MLKLREVTIQYTMYKVKTGLFDRWLDSDSGLKLRNEKEVKKCQARIKGN